MINILDLFKKSETRKEINKTIHYKDRTITTKQTTTTITYHEVPKEYLNTIIQLKEK